MTKPIIELKDVWKTYKMGQVKVHALRGVSLTIKEGEFVTITGPSGSGKSTLMNMVGCLDTPSKGTVKLSGKDISKMSESTLASIRGKTIGFIFQQFNLLTSLTSSENVTLPLMFQQASEQKREKKAKEFLSLVGLGDRMHHTPNQLSGGQQQRVAIARALAGEPKLILADEPTGNLDSKSGKDVMDFLLKRWKKEKITLVIVTHDPKLADMAPRKIMIKDGEIVDKL
ncbi:MAG: ABC transporter ATP-binding protein [Candidatus Woesearchaeota archaeon]